MLQDVPKFHNRHMVGRPHAACLVQKSVMTRVNEKSVRTAENDRYRVDVYVYDQYVL